jgi:hypothetical protein
MIWFWLKFVSFIISLLSLDLGVIQRKALVIKSKAASLRFFSGYLQDKPLSLYTLFVIAVVYTIESGTYAPNIGNLPFTNSKYNEGLWIY